MPFRDPGARLRDINENIEHIQDFVLGMKLDDFMGDHKAQAAVERKLLLLSHAAVKLGDEAERICPGIPWAGIRGIGNWLQHQYERTNAQTVWNTINDDLPRLKAALEKALVA